MKQLLTLVMLTALTVAAAPPRRLVMLPTGGITLGGEFPGAKGTSEISSDKPVTAKLDFDLTKGNYVGFVHRCLLTEGTTTFSFMARPSIPNTRLFVRTMDSKGRQHMRRIPNSISPGQWEERSVDLSKFQDSWGAGEAKIHWPITEIVIGIEVDKKHAIGSLELRDFIVTTTATRENMPSVSLQVTPSRFGALFYPEDPITIQYKGGNIEMKELYDVTLIFSFEKKGVLSNPEDDESVIPVITRPDFEQYKADGTISGGMLPKIENALAAVEAGVSQVIITLATAIDGQHGTIIK